jgi:hypothetical protein
LRQTGSTAGLVPLSKRSSSAALAPHPVLQEGLTHEERLTNAHASRVEVESPAGTGQQTQRSRVRAARDHLPWRAETSAALLSLDRRVTAPGRTPPCGEHQRAARLHRDHPPVANAVCRSKPQQDAAQAAVASTLAHQRRLPARVHLGRERQQRPLRARSAGPLSACLRESRMSKPEGMLLLAAGTAFASRERAVAQPRTLRGLENYPGRGLTWRCSCQSSPAASSASWTCCHAAPPDSSSRMRTCPRSSGICLPRPRCLATAASSSSARLPGRITWTTIAVSGTRPIVVAGHDTHRQGYRVSPPSARNLARSRGRSRRVGNGRALSAATPCCSGPRGAQDAVELARADDQQPVQLGLPGTGFGADSRPTAARARI